MGKSILRLYNNEMKKLLAAMFLAFLIFGCGFSEDEVLEEIRKAKENGNDELNLNYSSISDLTPLTGLKDLKRLYLFENKINDIGPLA